MIIPGMNRLKRKTPTLALLLTLLVTVAGLLGCNRIELEYEVAISSGNYHTCMLQDDGPPFAGETTDKGNLLPLKENGSLPSAAGMLTIAL